MGDKASANKTEFLGVGPIHRFAGGRGVCGKAAGVKSCEMLRDT